MRKFYKLFLIPFFVGANLSMFSQVATKTAVANARWDQASTWSPTGVPTATDNVLIPNGRDVRIRNANAACNSLTVGAGTAATLQFRSNTARTLSVTTNIVINANAALDIRTASNTTHSLVIGGNITNNGKLDFAVDNNSFCDVRFIRNGSQTVSGTGTLTRFHNIHVNMGTSITNTVEITAANFAAGNGFLTITNGTFKLSTMNAVAVSCFSVAATIPSTGRLFLNSTTAALTASANVTLNGNITIANGSLNIGNAADEDLISNGGTLSMAAGVLNIAGKYNATGTASTFSLTGGTINVPVFGSNNTTTAPFSMVTAGSSFNMSGGIINIIREGGLLGLNDLGFTNTGGTLGTVTGGTLQIGTAATPGGQTMRINSVATIGNLTIGSANATASLVTNNLNVFRNVLISSGTLNANNLNITLGGNWTNNGGTHIPGTGTTTFSSTIAQSIFKTGGETFNNLTFSGSGVKTFSSAVISNSNVTINSGASVDVSTSNHSLTIAKNFSNSGAINTQSGTILFNGTSAQTIGGTSITNFWNLSINNTSGGVSLTNAENLLNTLTLSSGTLSTNSQSFTMISTASNTARIGPIVGTGNIIGNVTVQRFAPGSVTGWALIGTPISSALTLNDWDDNIYISCPTCPDGSASGFLSIYTYDETKPGLNDDPTSYIPLSTINDPIIPNKGYWVYLGTGSVTTANITLDVRGSVRKFNTTIPLSKTNNTSTAEDGWNLIHNPYPSAISWTALRNGNASVDNAIYVYNADLNGGSGAHATYINNVSSPAVGSGGIGDNIPMCQGFYVHCTAATNLTAQETNKVTNNPTFLKIDQTFAGPASSLPLIRFTLKNAAGFEDETVLYYQTGATDNFDGAYDAYKMSGQDPKAPTIALEKTNKFQINGIHPISGNFSMPMKTLTGYTGTYTITAVNISSFPAGACVNLYDRFTGITTDLKTSDYVFTLADTTSVARFDVNITSNTLNITSTTSQPSCAQPNSGEITAIGASAGPWNYTWRDAFGNIIKTTTGKPTADTLNNLSGNTYYVEVNTVGNCDNNTTTFVLNPIVVPVAAFTSEDSTDLNWGGLVNFVNTSTNSSSDYWEFGDGGTSTSTSPSYNYNTTGTFVAKLITTSSTGCNDTITKNILVRNDQAIGIQTYANSNPLLVQTLNDNEYLITQNLGSEMDLKFELRDISGRLITDYGTMRSDRINLSVDLKDKSRGVYFLTITENNKPVTIKLPVK